MLFQGTAKYPSGEISKIVESKGGKFNAYTSYDTTVYHITMPRESIKTGLDILASMMKEATIDEEILKKEIEVIMEEFRRANDDPRKILQKKLFKVAFSQHPYRHPVIGYAQTIRDIRQSQVKSFYKEWYIPENMTLVIVGDFNKSSVKDLIQKTFGVIKPQPNSKRKILAEPPQKELKTVIFQEPFDNVYLSLGFHITAFDHEDTPVLDVLYTILGRGRSSRLVQVLREEKKLVTGISAYSYTPEQAGFGFIDAELKGANITSALEAILTEVYRLHYEPVSLKQLTKAKLLLESDFIYDKENYARLARKLGFFEVVAGNAEKELSYLESIRSVASEDIREVVRKYLTSDNLAVGILYPRNEDNIISRDVIASINKRSIQKLKRQYELRKKDIISSRKYDESTNVTRLVYKNGLTLLIREDYNVETLAIQAVFLGGLRSEDKKSNGISNFLSQMLLRGTAIRNQAEIARDIEEIAAVVVPFSGRNSFGISARSLSVHNKPFFKIIADILLNSVLEEDQVEVVRFITLDSIKRKKDNPVSVALNTFTSLLYGSHPYSMDVLGTEESIQGLTRGNLIQYSRKYMVPQNLVLAVVGDLQTEEVINQISSTFGEMSGEKNFAFPDLLSPSFPKSSRIQQVIRDTRQANIILGFPGITFASPQRFAFEVTNQILSGFGGRLFDNLRNKESLAYSVDGFKVDGYLNRGFYAVYMGTSPDKTKQAIAGIKRELKKIIEEDVSDKELQAAIDYLTGTFAIDLQTFSSQAQTLAFAEKYGLGYDDYTKYINNIRAVTKEDVRTIAQEYFLLDKHIVVIVGPKDIEIE